MDALKIVLLLICVSIFSACSSAPKSTKSYEQHSRPYSAHDEEIMDLIWRKDLVKLEEKITSGTKLKDVRGIIGDTTTHKAVNTKDLLVLDFVLKNKSPLDQPNNLSTTPLMEAIRDKNVQMVQYLLQQGANPNVRNNFKDPLFFIALESHSWEIVQLLMEYKSCPIGLGFMGKTIHDYHYPREWKPSLDKYVAWYQQEVSLEVPEEWTKEDEAEKLERLEKEKKRQEELKEEKANIIVYK